MTVNVYTPYHDVMCPRCNSTFWEVWLDLPNPSFNISSIRMCRRCAEELVKEHPKWTIREMRE